MIITCKINALLFETCNIKDTRMCTHTLIHTVHSDLVDVIFHNVVSFNTDKSWFLNTILHEKESGFLREMSILGLGQRKHKMNLETVELYA